MEFQHSIKAKALCVIAAVFLLQALFSTRSILNTYAEYRSMRLSEVRQTFELHCQNMNRRVLLLQKSVTQLGAQAEMYLALPQEWRPSAAEFTERLLKDSPEAVGGGLWFAPRMDDAAKDSSCIYFGRHTSVLTRDPAYESAAYDYQNQQWYTFIMEHSRQWLGIIWTPPYVDENSSGKILMTTLGYPLYHKGLFMGMATLDWELSDILERITLLRPTEGSFTLFADLYHDVVLVDTNQKGGGFGTSMQTVPWLKLVDAGQSHFEYKGLTYLSFNQSMDNGMVVMLAVPEEELYAPVRHNMYSMFLWFCLSSLLLLALTWYLLQRFISKPVQAIANKALFIGKGNLDARMPMTDKGELGALAHVLNTMTENLQRHMATTHKLTQEKERIAAELDVATRIQTAMLPCIFPAFPDRSEFDLYGFMRPAREVGGDFYDFFMVDDNHLALIIADVSGKGVPAALFMVITKTLLKNHMQNGLMPCDALTVTNRQLCENNSMNMFVTVWAGLLTLESGHLRYANAGHNKALWSHPGAPHESIGKKRSFVVGGLEGSRYSDEHCTLSPGDRLLLYTDGITEAENADHAQFSMQRLLLCADASLTLSTEKAALSVVHEVDSFTAAAAQTDDITLLLLEYAQKQETHGARKGSHGRRKEDEASETWKCRLLADTAHFPDLRARLEDTLARHHCPKKALLHLTLALEEAFANIANHAYAQDSMPGQGPNGGPEKRTDRGAGQGEVHVECSIVAASDNEEGHTKAVLRFRDKGKPFNPLQQDEPDLALPVEQRSVGGLGIHMLQKTMDSLQYTRHNEENILTVTKSWPTPAKEPAKTP